MLSKSKISFIKSLHQKKYRKQYGLFILEGFKSISEFIGSPYQIESVYYTAKLSSVIAKFSANINLFEISDAELQKISTLQNPQGMLALVHIPEQPTLSESQLEGKFSLVLDNVQDPGNLGTIIRTADWFGIENIICSNDTAEVYNPKTVQSTMGSLARTKVWYTDLTPFLAKTRLAIYGAVLNGQDIYDVSWEDSGLILLGNEGHGIGQILAEHVSNHITIPRIGRAESLNVAISAALFCSELARTRKI